MVEIRERSVCSDCRRGLMKDRQATMFNVLFSCTLISIGEKVWSFMHAPSHFFAYYRCWIAYWTINHFWRFIVPTFNDLLFTWLLIISTWLCFYGFFSGELYFCVRLMLPLMGFCIWYVTIDKIASQRFIIHPDVCYLSTPYPFSRWQGYFTLNVFDYYTL